MSCKYTIGIDEAGRGPLAGPVCVAAVAVKSGDLRNIKKLFSPIRGKDSKKLTEKEREKWFAQIESQKNDGKLVVAYSLVSAPVIDKKGIVRAVSMGIERSLNKLSINPRKVKILLDGLLKAPKQYKKQKTIIRGDETELTIRLASIVAKVRRDAVMRRVSRLFPEYGLEKHKGYGTELHRNMIKKKGLSLLHRKSFCRAYTHKKVGK